MSIIIQTGHKSSKSNLLMQRLYERGLEEPSNSYTHQMPIIQVTEVLYKILSRENLSPINEKLAENIIIDVLLSNIDSKDWGWESDKNLVALKFWQNIEHDFRFILVFDHPNNVLKELMTNELTLEIIDQAIDEWVNYHKEMLKCLENNNKLILVEGKGAINNIKDLGEKLDNIVSNLYIQDNYKVREVIDDTFLTEYSNQVVTDILSTEILRKYPEAIRIFNIMLSKASIKNSEVIYKTKNMELSSLIEILNYVRDNNDNYKYFSENNLLKEEISNIKKKILKQNLDNSELVKKLSDELNQLRLDKSKKENIILDEKLKEEKKLLIKQLHQTQDELERYYRKNKNLENNINKNILHSKNPTYYGAADRVKNELAYRVGERMVKAKRTKDIVALPLTLAKEYRKYNLEKDHIANLPDIKEYNDFQEVEKVKRHLSYRVGNLVINTSKTPKSLFLMPFKISKEVIDFKKKK